MNKYDEEVMIEEMIEHAKDVEARITQIEEDLDRTKGILFVLYNKLRKLI